MRISNVTLAGAVLGFLASATTAIAENWPGFRGPTGQGFSSETGLPLHWTTTSNVAWQTAIPGLGWSSPIIYGNQVFVTTATGDGVSLRLLCLDRSTGRILWDREVFQQILSRREEKNSFATPTPVTDGERVYVMSFNGTLAALRMDGSPAWSNTEFKFYGQHGPGVSLRLYQDLVIVPFDGSSEGGDKTLGWQKPWDQSFILALDRNTGKVRWKAARGLSRIAHVTPNVLRENGQEQLVSAAGDVVQGFDLRTGERLWTCASKGEGVVPSIVSGDGLVFTASGFPSPVIRAIRTGGKGDITQTHIAWEQKKNAPAVCSFAYVRPHLFVNHEAGAVMCLKAQTGEIVWSNRLPGHYSASPVVAEGRIYFLSEEGQTTVIEAGPEFKIIAQNSLEGACQASMAVSQGNLFIRTDKRLFCLGQPAAPRAERFR